MKAEKCVDCAVKHLRAALAYAVTQGTRMFPRAMNEDTVTGEIGRAAVLMSEVPSYPGHFDIAVGCLVKAEDLACSGVAERIRGARLSMTGQKNGQKCFLHDFQGIGTPDMFHGHLLEAKREGGLKFPDRVTPEEFVRDFEEYITAVGEDPAEAPREKGGE